jgi:uncharacterized protein (TIGR04222 family)
MFNPFALHGLDFLIFYAVVGVGLVGLQFFWTRIEESRGLPPQLQMTDPYQIAYLRAGAPAALRVVALSLVDRGLLSAGGTTLMAEPNSEQMVRRPIEKAVLRLYRTSDTAKAMLSDSRTRDACQEYEDTLQSFGLVAGKEAFARRLPSLLSATVPLVFIGALKINLALSEGRHNIGFLIMLMLVFGAICAGIFRRRRTKLGDDMMADLRLMFGRLRDRADTLRQGGATNEAALLAAVFGLGALPLERFPAMHALKRTNSSTSSGCGSSCSSGGGSSCSSCGGGCGGGCGG